MMKKRGILKLLCCFAWYRCSKILWIFMLL